MHPLLNVIIINIGIGLAGGTYLPQPVQANGSYVANNMKISTTRFVTVVTIDKVLSVVVINTIALRDTVR